MENLFVWEKPQKGFHYSIGFDPAGAGIDATCAEVLCYETRKFVAEYHDTRVQEPDSAKALRKLGRYYNTALLVIERVAGYGLYTVEYLLDKSYPRLYHRQTKEEVGRAPQRKIGWLATPRTVPELMSNFWYAIQCARLSEKDPKLAKDAVFILSPWFQEELTRFAEKEDKSLGANSSTKWKGSYVNDDRVRGGALALEGVRKYGIPSEDSDIQEARDMSLIPTKELRGAVLFKYLQRQAQSRVMEKFLPDHIVASMKQQEQEEAMAREAKSQKFLRYF